MAPLLQTGHARGKGDHCMICQSIYKEVSAHGLVSDFRNGCNQKAYFLFIKAVMKK